MAGRSFEADRRLDAGTAQLADGQEPFDELRLFILLAPELGLDRRRDIESGTGGDGDDLEADSLNLEVGRGDLVGANPSCGQKADHGEDDRTTNSQGLLGRGSGG